MAYETKPKFDQVRHYLSKAIRTGKFEPGQRLPSERALAIELEVNHLTVRRGLAELVNQGLITKQPRVGTFVADDAFEPGKRVKTFLVACRDYFFDIDSHHPSLAAYLAGAKRVLKTPDYAMQVMSFRRFRFQDDIAATLLRTNVDGVAIMGDGLVASDFAWLRAQRIQAMGLAIEMPSLDDAWVIKLSWRREEAISQLAEYIHDLGHRRIGLITWKITPHHRRLEDAFVAIMSKHGITGAENQIVTVRNPTGHMHFEDVDQFFNIDPLPTAVIVNDEYIAEALISRCDQRGIAVPKDLSVVSLFNATPRGGRMNLTTVYGPKDLSKIAYVGCRLLTRMDKGYAVPRTNHYLSAKLKIGDSSLALVEP